MKISNLSEEGFIRLLAQLNPDSSIAGEEYEKLRARLIYFFERKGCRIPEELGDETLNRLARKIEEGHQIEDLFKYSHGVARLVLLEHWNDPKREWDQLDEQLSSSMPDWEVGEHRRKCMKKCLQSLTSEEREIIIKNCTLKKGTREEMAKALGLTLNALRLRVFRIRAKLHQCREECLKS